MKTDQGGLRVAFRPRASRRLPRSARGSRRRSTSRQDLQQNNAVSGIVLIPIFYVLSLPAIEAVGAVTSVVSSALLLALMLVAKEPMFEGSCSAILQGVVGISS